MKKLACLFILSFVIMSCEERPVALETIEAEFIYLADAAVLKGNDFIYGVTIDEKMHELAEAVELKKKDEYDMIPVIVKGIIRPKPDGVEGWPEIVTIKEIIKIKESAGDDAIKIESQD